MTSTSTIPAALNDAFVQEPDTATNTVVVAAVTTTGAFIRTYEYCQCYGTFVAEVDQPDIDASVVVAQQFHETTEAIVQSDSCGCPVCVGHLGQCEECDGLYLVKDEDETEEYDEYEEDGLRGYTEESDTEEPPSHPKTRSLFMDLEEIEESMAQVVLSSKSPS
jgi:hypothetical protein